VSRHSVYIIVLTWNGWRDTEECLRSLAPVIEDGVRVLLVDNGSTDGTPGKVRALFPRVEVIENGRNLGFPGGNNAGMREALSRGADYVILLNNDTVVDRDFARELLRAAERDPRVGMATSKIYFRDRPQVLWFAGGDVSTWTGRSRHAGFGETDRGQFDDVEDIGRPCGCAMLVSRALLEDVGLMEEDLFLYGEEIDWVLRARRRGYRCVLAPRSKVWHKVSAGTGGPSRGDGYYYAVRNMLRTLRRHAPHRFAPLNGLRVVLVASVFTASLFTLGIDKRTGLAHIAAGVRDYLRGAFGERDRIRPGSRGEEGDA
jgi:GT2 family glycosyltransferase